jgi:hypothetical protein
MDVPWDGPQGERIPVRFEGPGAGTGELSWGQREIWQAIQRKDWWLPIGTVLPLPADTTVDSAVADLRFVMTGYPSMRTRLRFADGGPAQVAAGSGETWLEVVDTAGEDPAEVARRVWRRYLRLDYDFARDWPLRMAVIRHRDVLSYRVWMMCHLVTDGGGGRVVLDELPAHDLSGSRAAMPPLAQARWQRSPAGQRVSTLALAYWKRSLDRLPVRGSRRGAGVSPRYWEGRIESPATHLAAQAIAARTGTGLSSVLLAAFAVARARVTGVNPVAVQVTVGNRFRPGLARSVSPLMQNGLCVIEVPDGNLDEAVKYTQQRVMAAYKHAYYDPQQREELLATLTEQRGEPDIGCHFNDRRLKTRDETGPAPTPERIRAAVREGTFAWRSKQDDPVLDQLYFNVEDVPDRTMVTVTLDAQYEPPETAAECLHEMEAVAVAAALDPAAPIRVPPARHRGR